MTFRLTLLDEDSPYLRMGVIGAPRDFVLELRGLVTQAGQPSRQYGQRLVLDAYRFGESFDIGVESLLQESVCQLLAEALGSEMKDLYTEAVHMGAWRA